MRVVQKLGLWLMALAFATGSFAQSSSSAQTKVFSNEQLDQMLAPIALYPDSLLSQVLMASTYPIDVKAAAAWSKSNKGKEGDAAVTAVESQGWDPSVASLVAFPSLIQQMGEHPDEVQKIGDAFLAQPSDVMDSVQRLRAAAQKAGNLKTTEQQKVVVEQQKIIIEPAQPQTVYVPAYNPAVVYGTWWYPSYPPYYWPPPYGYYPGAILATGIAWGVAIGVGNAVWGGINWGNNDVNINVNKYNNINRNNQITNVRGGDRTSWQHNAENRKGAPYRDEGSRQKFDRQVAGANDRQQYRGKQDAHSADRARAEQAMRDRGVDTGSGRAGDRAGDRPGDRAGAAGGGHDFNRGSQGMDRSGPAAGNRDSAFAGAGNAAQTRQAADRGRASAGAGASHASRPSPAARSAPAARPSGGGGHRGGGGGGRGGRR